MNGGDPFDFPNPFPFPDFSRPPGEGNKRRGGGGRRIPPRRTPPVDAGLPAIPLPVPLPPSVNIPIFGTFPDIPAANQPFPTGGIAGGGARVAAARILGAIGGAVIGTVIFETGVQIFRRKIELDKERARRVEEAELERAAERKARRTREGLLKTIPNPLEIPSTAPAESPEIIVVAPRPIFESPVEIPDISAPPTVPAPVSPTIPTPTLPGPSPIFAPIPGFGVPGPAPLPAPNPFPFPGTFPLGLPRSFPRAFPVSFPIFTPVGDIGLTPLEPVGVPSGGTGLGFIELPDPSAQPKAQAQQCEAVERRRRKKGKCRSGFFRERPGSTDFITWHEGEC